MATQSTGRWACGNCGCRHSTTARPRPSNWRQVSTSSVANPRAALCTCTARLAVGALVRCSWPTSWMMAASRRTMRRPSFRPFDLTSAHDFGNAPQSASSIDERSSAHSWPPSRRVLRRLSRCSLGPPLLPCPVRAVRRTELMAGTGERRLTGVWPNVISDASIAAVSRVDRMPSRPTPTYGQTTVVP